MIDIQDIIEEKILAILPIYTKNYGNNTKIITLNKEYIINKSVKTILKHIAGYYLIDLKYLRNYCRDILGTINVIPIIYNSENIFIPFKARKPMFKNDGALGYFNINYLSEICKENNDVFIYLNSDIKIKCYQSYKTIIKHVNDGKLIGNVYDNRVNAKDIDKNIFVEYEKPATKADIALLRNELIDLIDKLKEILQ